MYRCRTARLPSTTGAALWLAPMVGAPALAAPTSVSLQDYRLDGVYLLPVVAADEASAITYNWDTDTLFVLGDEGDAVVEVSRTGTQLSVMTLTGFDDTEGLTYLGGGRFAVVEERLRDVFELSYAAGGTADRSSLPSVDLGATVGNIGLEGISLDPRDGTLVTVKEKTPQEVNRSTVTFGSPGTATTTPLFTPNLGVLDLADVQVLASVPSLAAGPDGGNLLVLSQESSRLLEVSPAGSILGSFDLLALTDSAEGVTIDFDGTIYVVDESPRLYVLKPVPLPGAAWLLLGAAAALGCLRHRQPAG